MGLDVYLYYYPNGDKKEWDKKCKECDERSNENWESLGKKYDEITERERDEISQKNREIEKSLGLEIYGEIPEEYRKTIEKPSKIYPEHYWKIGYFRSSYNPSGINNILYDLCEKHGLYYIFNVKDEDEYETQPDYDLAIKRAKEMIEVLKSNRFMTISCYSPHKKSSQFECLEDFKKKKDELPNHNCANGYATFFNHEPIKVYAVYFIEDQLIQDQCCLITDSKYQSYIESLEILIETCEYIMDQPDAENYYLAWSG